MFERSISSTTAAAILLWPLGFILILVDVFTSHQTGQLGLFAAAGGAVFNVRGFFCKLHKREQNAFELGRDYASSAEVRSLR